MQLYDWRICLAAFAGIILAVFIGIALILNTLRGHGFRIDCLLGRVETKPRTPSAKNPPAPKRKSTAKKSSANRSNRRKK